VFRNSPPGHPTSWVPFVFLLPRIIRRARLSRPHPFGKGRGDWGCILASEGVEAVEVEPTSLNRGEGLVGDLTCVVEEGEGEGEGGVERWWRRRERTKINRDAVDVRFKLRSPR